MKRIFAVILSIAMCGVASATVSEPMQAPLSTAKMVQGEGVSARSTWSIWATNDDVDESAYELIADYDSWAQITETDKIELVSADAADSTMRVVLVGIDKRDSTRYVEKVQLKGTSVATTADSFYALEYAFVDSGDAPVGAVTIRDASGNTAITTIAATKMIDYVGHKFMYGSTLGKKTRSYVTGWWGQVLTTTGTISLQLRWYPELRGNAYDLADGFYVIDTIVLPATVGAEAWHVFPQPVELVGPGILAIYGLGGAANSDCNVMMQGYDQ